MIETLFPWTKKIWLLKSTSVRITNVLDGSQRTSQYEMWTLKYPCGANNKDKYLKPNSYKYVSSNNIFPPPPHLISTERKEMPSTEQSQLNDIYTSEKHHTCTVINRESHFCFKLENEESSTARSNETGKQKKMCK